MKKLLVFVIVILVAIGAFAESAQIDESAIVITSDESSMYSREIVLNKGTSDEYIFTGFFVPAGVYDVTNNDSYGTQISFYVDGTNVTEQGIEEPIICEQQRPVVIMPGSTEQVKILPGCYVKVADGSYDITLKLILPLETQQ